MKYNMLLCDIFIITEIFVQFAVQIVQMDTLQITVSEYTIQ